MAKNIVICCDGTGNEYGDRNSNVVHLYESLIIDEDRQVGYYHPGLGTEGSPTSHTKLGAKVSTAMGLAFGAGLLRYIGDAYRYLMNVYEEGDRVYLFGFSRGAYTVRAIAGVLHMFGLLHRGNDGLIPYIIQLYAKKTREAAGMTHTFQVASGFKATYCRPCPLHLVAVWDTVSSVGWVWDPLKLPYTARNPDMAHGRHAMSIDERRCYFRNNLWGPAFPGQTIKQVWFSGVHSDVGGSYLTPQSGLSQIALQWMMCEAVSLGLLVDPQRAEFVLGRVPPPPAINYSPITPDPRQPIHKSLRSWWWLLELLPHSYYDDDTQKKKWRIPFGAARTIPKGSVFHQSVRQKITLDPTYKPMNLPPDWQNCEECDNLCIFPQSSPPRQ